MSFVVGLLNLSYSRNKSLTTTVCGNRVETVWKRGDLHRCRLKDVGYYSPEAMDILALETLIPLHLNFHPAAGLAPSLPKGEVPSKSAEITEGGVTFL